MRRRVFLRTLASAGTTLLSAPRLSTAMGAAFDDGSGNPNLASALRKDWLNRWEKSILADARNRYCDKETGEELGWLVSPFLNGFYYGFLATDDAKWIERLVDWADACLNRAIKEPDGFLGWPKGDGGGGESKSYQADSLLGEAMLLRPMILASAEIRKKPSLSSRWGKKADAYIEFAEKVFQKWDSRDCWRQTKQGGLWVVPPFGIDGTGKWSEGYSLRKSDGFSNPDNKQNHIARWLLALYEATQKDVYLQRARAWFELMKSRLKSAHDDKYLVWNYWEPAGPWDYKPDGSPKHWIGVHPNGGYYAIDVEGMVSAFEHKLVFTKEDIDKLVATNRDFMWDQKVDDAKFQRIDGGSTDPRWKNSPGVLWTALVPYDETLKKVFLANHKPEGWGALGLTPWFLSLS